jgi:hypothetical protein
LFAVGARALLDAAHHPKPFNPLQPRTGKRVPAREEKRSGSETLAPTPTPFPARPRGAPLYLGQLRARLPASYSALLAYRPDKPGPGAAAVIGTNLSSREPRYSLLAEGQIITLEQRDGAFHALLLFLSYHAAKRQGLLGGRYLSEWHGLERVVAPGGPAPSVPQRVWSWWYPRGGL